MESLNPDDAKKQEMRERMAKARAARKAPEASVTEHVPAPETVSESVAAKEPEVQVVERVVEKIVYVQQPPPAPTLPRQKRIERQGDVGAPSSRRWPQVRGGICEYCGVLDGNVPSQFQYKMCGHYRGMQLRCSYCPPQKDADDVNGHTNLNVADNPYNPDELIVWCDSYSCSDKHIKRFTQSTS